MKTKLTTLLLTAFLAALATGAQAASSKQKLIKSLYQEQRQAEKRIVTLWMNNERGEKLENTITEYVVREVRLQAMTGDVATRTLLSGVKSGHNGEIREPLQLAKAIVIQYFRQNGVHFDDYVFVKGRYLIKSSTIDFSPDRLAAANQGTVVER